MERHRSSKQPFFERLKRAPTSVVRVEAFLEELYKRYQGAMHASRVMAYHMPHLDTIELRMIKFRVLADDDGAPGGDSHHYQLRRTWTEFLDGRPPAMTDEDFGDLDELRARLDPATARWVALCQELYPRTLGPWVMVEGLAHDWIGALQDGLAPHFPGIEQSDYFRENYGSCVEVEHARESLDTTMRVLSKKPESTAETLEAAAKIGEGLHVLWEGMDGMLLEALRAKG